MVENMPEFGLKFLTPNDAIKKVKSGEKDFSKCKIVGADFSGMDLSNATFESSELEWVRFGDCKLIGTNFAGAKIDLSYFSNSNLTKAVFKKAQVYNSYFGSVILDKTDFGGADLRYVLFIETNVGAADFSGANRIRMLTSFGELTQEDFNFVVSTLGKIDMPPQHRAAALIIIGNVKTMTEEKLLKFYDMGRMSMTASMKDYSPGTVDAGVYPRDAGVYTDKAKYGERKDRKKSLLYR